MLAEAEQIADPIQEERCAPFVEHQTQSVRDFKYPFYMEHCIEVNLSRLSPAKKEDWSRQTIAPFVYRHKTAATLNVVYAKQSVPSAH